MDIQLYIKPALYGITALGTLRFLAWLIIRPSKNDPAPLSEKEVNHNFKVIHDDNNELLLVDEEDQHRCLPPEDIILDDEKIYFSPTPGVITEKTK